MKIYGIDINDKLLIKNTDILYRPIILKPTTFIDKFVLQSASFLSVLIIKLKYS